MLQPTRIAKRFLMIPWVKRRPQLPGNETTRYSTVHPLPKVITGMEGVQDIESAFNDLLA